ncbi:carboxymuconolactone decarboxylase family protein [Pseudorhodoplanes sp.]|uniref:carboxymuconolactone decarboxylase family protein n=1 Tax=Pseudorhodoplanes sp. TaxID=1934341 RepID=UPI003D0AFF69
MSTLIPRLGFEELAPEVADGLRAKVARLGYLGEFFAATAHQPQALKAFMDFTEFSKGELDMRLVELIALTVATIKHVAYERNQHERLAVRLGYGRAWIAAVEALAPDDQPELSREERTVQRFVISAVRSNGIEGSMLLDAVVEQLGVKRAVAVLFVMGRYTTHAIIVNSLAITAPVPSIFEDGFNG